jgi:hypothetical protein
MTHVRDLPARRPEPERALHTHAAAERRIVSPTSIRGWMTCATRDPATEEDRMKKLKLEIESLAVDSFQTAQHANDRGTVDAHLGHQDKTLKTICASLLASNPTCCPCTPMI